VLGYWSLTEHAWYKGGWDAPGADPNLLKPIFLIFTELSLITALALLFSTFSSPILSAVLTFGLYIVGHFNADLRHFERVVPSRIAAAAARSLYYLLPNLAPFDVSSAVVHGQPVAFGYLALTVGYAVAYIAVLLTIATFIFDRRDFK
jgi:ABC-type transport system involved in multi-copper enzyme maturation permease subunit